MKGIYLDPDSDLVGEHFAVIYAPRRQRGRFPEECVEIKDSEAAALDEADPSNKRYAARVVGPARSSEGFRLYYLLAWLDEGE